MNKTDIILAAIAAVGILASITGVRRYVVALALKLEAEAKHLLADIEAKETMTALQVKATEAQLAQTAAAAAAAIKKAV